VGVCFVWTSDKNTHSHFLLYIYGKSFHLYKIFMVCLWGIRHSIEVKIKYSLHSNFYLLPWFRETYYSQTCKNGVRIVTGSNEYLIFMSAEYLIPHEHTLKNLCKSNHFPQRYKRKREWVFFLFWTQCRVSDEDKKLKRASSSKWSADSAKQVYKIWCNNSQALLHNHILFGHIFSCPRYIIQLHNSNDPRWLWGPLASPSPQIWQHTRSWTPRRTIDVQNEYISRPRSRCWQSVPTTEYTLQLTPMINNYVYNHNQIINN